VIFLAMALSFIIGWNLPNYFPLALAVLISLLQGMGWGFLAVYIIERFDL